MKGAFADHSEIMPDFSALLSTSATEAAQQLWAIPGVRMKGDRTDKPHEVPLTEAALSVLDAAREALRKQRADLPRHEARQAHQRRDARQCDCTPYRREGHDTRFPVDVPRLGWGYDELPARAARASAGPRYRRRNGGSLSAVGRFGEAAIIDGRMGRVLYV
jgi:hypothetical protein